MREVIEYFQDSSFPGGALVLGFSGWMDGGMVSTGTVDFLRTVLGAEKAAAIRPEGFYIYSFPGPMEFAAIFRPATRIVNGIVEALEPPQNPFYACAAQRLLLFSGKEPNLNWTLFADCILAVCERFRIEQVYFVGSVGGLTPHTREPRISTSASCPELRDRLVEIGIRPTNYEGPASFVTYLLTRAAMVSLPMATLVAEIPAYVQGPNPRCIETMVRLIARLLDLQVDVSSLHADAEVFTRKLDAMVRENQELWEKINELEKQYDSEAFDHDLAKLKPWLDQQNLRVE